MERIRSQLATAGAAAAKHEIIRVLAELHQRRMIQMDAGRRWNLRENPAAHRPGRPSAADAWKTISSPCRAVPVRAAEDLDIDSVPDGGSVDTSFDLLMQLLPYYQECLRTADGGSPRAVASRYGEHFSLLQPDRPWWPTAERGRTLLVPRGRACSLALVRV